MTTLASLAKNPIWAIGHSALDQDGVFWKGSLLFNGSHVFTVESRNDLASQMDELLA